MFVLPPLPYSYDALEPYLDARTMEIHYDRHHRGYLNKTNELLQKHPELFKQTINDLLRHLDSIPEDIRHGLRNFGGGFANHTLFWTCMKPGGGGTPQGEVAHAIEQEFGSFDSFKDRFTGAARSLFGSGWTWLVVTSEHTLEIMTTQDQDTPLSYGKEPLLALDLWEHAYYLKYQNKRPDFITAWWHVVNWDTVEQLYKNAVS
ncbi:superoxide dismutase [Candidatus Babeliales bacterium]|nr:superoxide dismutase [Candidatus Babeliales bacterium]